MHTLTVNNIRNILSILITCAAFNISIAHAAVIEVASAETGFKALSGVEFGGKVWNVDFSDTWSDSDSTLSASELIDAKVALNNYLTAQNEPSSIDSSGGEFGCIGMGRCQWILVGPNIAPNSEIRTLGRINNYYSSNGDNDSVSDNVDLSISNMTTILSAGSTANAMTFAHFTSPVPEPSTYAMFAAGLGLLLVTLRSGKSRQT